MNKAYKKECWLTLVSFLVATVLTHFYPIYFLFPQLTESMLFGFPTHYFLTLVVGWIALMPLYWVYIQMSEKIDAEIQETVPAAVDTEIAPSGTTSAAGGAL